MVSTTVQSFTLDFVVALGTKLSEDILSVAEKELVAGFKAAGDDVAGLSAKLGIPISYLSIKPVKIATGKAGDIVKITIEIRAGNPEKVVGEIIGAGVGALVTPLMGAGTAGVLTVARVPSSISKVVGAGVGIGLGIVVGDAAKDSWESSMSKTSEGQWFTTAVGDFFQMSLKKTPGIRSETGSLADAMDLPPLHLTPHSSLVFDVSDGTYKNLYNSAPMLEPISVIGEHLYVVKAGDSLWSIAQENGWSFDALLQANSHLADPNFILPGQDIYGLPPATVQNTVNLQTSTSPTPASNPVAYATDAPNTNGIFDSSGSYVATMNPAILNQGTGYAAALIGATGTGGFRPGAMNVSNTDSLALDIQRVTDALTRFQSIDEITAQVASGASILTNYGIGNKFIPADPIILDLNGDGVKLSSFADSTALFDIDNDGGSREHTGWVAAAEAQTDGMLVHDLNGDGRINGIQETLSEYYNGVAGTGGSAGTKPYSDGFAALRALDLNQDGVFSSQDAAWSQLAVWIDANGDGLSFVDANGNGIKDAGEVSELKILSELGISSINLSTTAQSGLVNSGNEVLATGGFTRNGAVHTAQAVRFIANPNGTQFSKGLNGTTLMTEGNESGSVIRSYVSEVNTNQQLSATALNVQNIYAGGGDDTLLGNSGSNWLSGGLGSDTFDAGDGDDVLLIDADDLAANINAGAGIDVVQVVGDRGVLFDMARAQAEVFVGGAGDDFVYGGGSQSVFLRGGGGADTLMGGAANDVLSGEDGDDHLSGGAGNDLLRGHRGRDRLVGGTGDDVLDGGLEDDFLDGGEGNDVLIGGRGDDVLHGGAGIDAAQFDGSYADYRITKLDDRAWRVVDTREGRDGSDTLLDIETLSFSDVSNVSLTIGTPLPVKDVLTSSGSGAPLSRTGQHLISKAQLLGNDRDWDSDVSQLVITAVLEAQGGTVSLTANGDVLFTPDPSFTGVMSFKYRIADEKGGATQIINSATGQSEAMKAAVYLHTSDLPSDPLAVEQWYLTEVGVLPVWLDYTGKGVRIGQFEPGAPFAVSPEVFDYRHPDLQANADLQWLNTLDSQGGSAVPQNFSNHATMVAGVMVAARNGVGGVGIAYDATLAGHYIQGEGLEVPQLTAELTAALALFKNYDVVNNSWGAQGNFSLNVVPPGTIQTGIVDALLEGRNGLGTAVVMAGGNDRQSGANTNYNALTANRGVITVGSINAPGDLGTLQLGSKPFSNPGASILVSAPGSNIGSSGRELIADNGSTFGSSYSTSHGTSFAAPIVSGVIALMLEANPALGYRDIQTILAMSATSVTDPNGTDWAYNGAKNWNGGGMHASHDYGFGQVDARAAVRLAETWTQQSGLWNEHVVTAQSGALNRVIPDASNSGASTMSTGLTMASGVSLESAQITVNLVHANWGDLIITLISPSGTRSVLVDRPGKAPGSGAGDRGDATSGTMSFSFNTTHVRGEDSGGTWTLQVTDAASGQTGTLKDWKLDLYGANDSADDVYVYTDEFKTAPGTARATLSDSDGGRDVINASAVTGNSVINLNAGVTSTIAGRSLTISGAIEVAMGGDGNDTLTGNSASNVLRGGRGNDGLTGGGGFDYLDGGQGNDTLTGGADADLFIIRRDAGSTDIVTDFDVASGIEKLVLVGVEEVPDFSALVLTQSNADVHIDLKQGQKLIVKNTTVSALSEQNFAFITNASLLGAYVDRWVNPYYAVGTAGSENVNVTDVRPVMSSFLLGGNDIASSYSRDDLMDGGNGNDILFGDSSTTPNGADWLEGGAGNDQLYGKDGDDILSGGSGDDQLRGEGGNDYLVGGSGLDYLDGGAGNDIVTFDGDVGMVADGSPAYLGTRVGGAGADRFKVLSNGGGSLGLSVDGSTVHASNLIADFNVSEVGETIDLTALEWLKGFADLRIQSFSVNGIVLAQVLATNGERSLNLTLYGVSSTQLRPEHFVFANTTPGEVIGTEDNDTLVGDAGANTIDGRAGADVMTGRTGDDTYIVDNVGDIVFELPGGGYDTVRSDVSYTLGADVEALVLTGAGNINATGNAQRNRLVGNSGANVLDGGAQADELVGGADDDIYVVDDQLDHVIELAGEGVDLVRSSVSWTLGQNVENLTLTGANSINATGNELANVLVGNAGNNVLDGAGGNDVMQGGLGNDHYFVDSAGDIVSEAADAGFDSIYTSVNLTLAANVEAGYLLGSATSLTGNSSDNTLVGNALANVLNGGAGNDILDGGEGADAMNGGVGDDTYWIDNSGDTVIELAGGGVDSMMTSISVNLAALGGGQVENAVLIGSANLSLSGNGLDNELIGNSGNNTLSGGAGNDLLDGGAGLDTMSGGAGDDVYVVDNAGDVVTELAAQGTDQVNSHLAAYTLGANIENGRIMSSGVADMTGNTLANLIYAGAGNNIIDGGVGTDTVSYRYAAAGVNVNLALATAQNTVGSGTDTLLNIENVIGTDFDDTLAGNAAGNRLDGGLGADTMAGGTGNDTYVVDDIGDIVIERSNEGTDLVESHLMAYTLGANLENIRIMSSGAANATGNSINNVLYAGDGDNVLDGGAGSSDTVAYTYASAGVSVSLATAGRQNTGGSGWDTLVSIERLTGSRYADTLTGNAGSNVLNGGAGVDTMIGGAGDDTYYVDSADDVVVEKAGEGRDTVYSSAASYTLADNVEVLRIIAANVANATGNALDNTLHSGTGTNVLDGAGGNDTVSYEFITGAVNVSLATTTAQNTGNAGLDTILNIENLTGSAHNDILAGNADANVIDGGKGADQMSGGAGDDRYIVDDAGDTVIEAAGAGIDQVDSFLSAYTLAANVENGRIMATGAADMRGNSLSNLIYAGDGNNGIVGGGGTDTVSYLYAKSSVQVSLTTSAAQNTSGSGIDTLVNIDWLTGSNYNDTLSGNAGSNRLDGGAGVDTMAGGAGDDLYYVDNPGDIIIEHEDEGVDIVYSRSVSYTLSNNVENLRIWTSSNANATGNGLDNAIYAGNGNNVIDGGGGNDTVSFQFAASAVTVSLASTGAQATGGSGTDTLRGFENLSGSDFNDTLTGNDGDNIINGGGGADTMRGGKGDDTYYVNSAGDSVIENAGEGTDLILSSLTAYTLSANVENGRVTSAGAANMAGNGLANILYAGQGNNVLDGAGGDDTVSYKYSNAAVTVSLALAGAQATGGSGSDTLTNIEAIEGSDYDDVLTGNDGSNVLTGGAGNDVLDGGKGADTLMGGSGDDIYVVDDAGDVVVEDADGGIDRVDSYSASYTLGANIENGRILATGAANMTGNDLDNVFYAGAGDNVFVGGGGSDTVSYEYSAGSVSIFLANSGTQNTSSSGFDTFVGINSVIGSRFLDVLNGNAGNNVLDGGAGADFMAGGVGDDLYYVDEAGDIVTEYTDAGVDTIYSTAASYSLNGINMRFSQVENLRILTSANANATGNSLANVIYAGDGDNVMDGEAGNDTLSYQYAKSGVTVSLATTAAQATGGSGTDTVLGFENLTGSDFDDTLTGTDADNILNGGRGLDTMRGGKGNDTYYVSGLDDIVIEAANEGIDFVYSAASWYTLTSNVENGRIMYSGIASMTGNELANTIYAGQGNNVLDGMDGNDTVSYKYSVAGVAVSLAVAGAQATGGSGADTLISIESLEGSDYDDVLTGNDGNNTLTGGAGNDELDGGVGADIMVGGTGDDIYVVDNAGDVVTEAANGGTDMVHSYLASYTLGTNVENGRIMSSGSANMVGNTLANLIYAGAGNNVINGGSGYDTVSYTNASSAVTVSLFTTLAQNTGGSGTDTLLSIEHLEGSRFNDTLTGNGFSNVLNGGLGADRMAGGFGDDTYYVDNVDDVVIERAGEGTDTVYASLASYTLQDNIENLYIWTVGNTTATGNALNNVMYSGAGNNIIDAGAGNDTVSYEAAASSVTVSLMTTAAQATGGSGSDALIGVENLTGSNFNDTLRGNAGNNILDGGKGADTLIGGAGSDTYVVDDLGDVVVEAANEGIDQVNSSLSRYTLGSNIENGRIISSFVGRASMKGNSADNLIYAGLGYDLILGGGGADTVSYAYATGDVVASLADVGTHDMDDAQIALALQTASFTQSDTLIGIRNLAGGDFNDVLTGNDDANQLGGGNGNDLLMGGDGSDDYLFNRGDGMDVIVETPVSGDVNTVHFGTDVGYDQLWFSQADNDLQIKVIGTNDYLTVQDWFSASGRIGSIYDGQGRELLEGRVQELVSAMAGMTPPASGQTSLPPNYQSTVATFWK